MPFLLRLSDLHTRLLQLFVLLAGLELVISPDRNRGIQDLLGIVIMFGLLAYFARASQHAQNWYWLALVSGVVAAAGSLVFYLQEDRLPYINPNAWAFFPLTALFAICLGLPFAAQRRAQLLLILLAVVNFAWVFLSSSRGDLLIGSCCLLFLVLRMRGLSIRILFLMSAVLLGVVISTQFTDLQAHTLQRIGYLLDPKLSLRYRTSGRSDLVLGGWYIFQDHPFGIGTGGFANTWADLGFREGLSGFKQGVSVAAHAGWVKLLVENGLPGILLFITYILSFAVVGLSRRDRDLLVLGILVTVILSIALISTEFQGKGLWLLATGVTTLLHREQIAAHLQGAARREPILNIIRPGNLRHGRST